jgi:hypothetical protein
MSEAHPPSTRSARIDAGELIPIVGLFEQALTSSSKIEPGKIALRIVSVDSYQKSADGRPSSINLVARLEPRRRGFGSYR